jgi:hypothetical protein
MANSKSRLRRQDRPPPVKRVTQIMTVTGNERISGVVISEAIWGFWTHWVNDRTRPCYKGRGHCDGCDQKAPSRWKGLIEVWENLKKPPVFVELTPSAAEELIAGLLDNDLRGSRVVIQRERNAKRAPLKVQFLEPYAGDVELPCPHDPQETLNRIWSLD